jgi:hypothetical protein
MTDDSLIFRVLPSKEFAVRRQTGSEGAMSDDWQEYRQQFYSLSKQEQQVEWEKMSPDQRARFEAVATPPAPPAAPPQTKKWSLPKVVLVVCGILLVVLLIGSMARDPDSDVPVDDSDVAVDSEPFDDTFWTEPATPRTAAPPAPAAAQWREIASWSGSGMKQTESFRTASREWRVHWQTANEPFPGAGILQIMVYSAESDSLITLAANKQGTGKDTSYVRAPPGLYYLMFNSGNVDWSVRVEDQR